MLLRLDDRDPSPLYRQIAAAVRRGIASGELSEGERLPSARALAEALGVNMHTVLRGYAEVEAEGLVRMRRSQGVTVCADAPSRARLYQLARDLVEEARRFGVSPEEVIAMVCEAK